MATKITIMCRSCAVKIRAASFDDFPDDCPKCGAVLSDPDKSGVAAPYIALKGGAYAKAVDSVYEDSVAAADRRIEAAVAMTPGSSKEDFASLKITDFRSNMVEGERAVNMPQPSQEFYRNVTALQNAGVPVQQNGGMLLTGQAQQYSASTRSGPEPNAGARAMSRLRSAHVSNLDPRIKNAVSSVPAIETQQPGYTPRT